MNLLNLDKIRIDGGTQPRCEIDSDLVGEYAEAMREDVEFPPVVVFHDGVHHWLADGFHRYHAARRAGLTALPADVRSGELRDAILFSVGANAAHGKRRTNADKRRAVMTLLEDEEWAKWSDREVARRAAVSHAFVGKFRGELPVNGEQVGGPTERKWTTRHGTEATMDTTNIGRGQHKKQGEPLEQSVELARDREPFVPPDRPLNPVSDAMHYAEIALTNLQCIRRDDPNRASALARVRDWIDNQEESRP